MKGKVYSFRFLLSVVAPLIVLMLCLSPLTVLQAQEPGPTVPPDQPAVEPLPFLGGWVGAKLQCRKDESGPVRCGTPSPFRVYFNPDGTGKAQGEGFPSEFRFEYLGENKVRINGKDKAKHLEIFEIKVEADFLSFQAYIYPEGDKEVGEEYIHYLFDLARDMEVQPQPPPERKSQ